MSLVHMAWMKQSDHEASEKVLEKLRAIVDKDGASIVLTNQEASVLLLRFANFKKALAERDQALNEATFREDMGR